MYLFQQFLPSLLTAALLCAAVLLPGIWWTRWRELSPAIALALGYAGGHIVAVGRPAFPPTEAAQWLPWFALVGAAIGIMDRTLRPPVAARLAGWLVVGSGLMTLLLMPGFQHHWNPTGGALRIAAVVGAMLLVSAGLSRAERVGKGALNLSLILWIAGAGTAVTLLMSGSALLGQLALIFTSAAGVLAVSAAVFPRSELRTVNPVATVLLSALIVSGGFYADLPLASALLLVLALLSAALPDGAVRGQWKPLMIRAGVACAASALSVVMALRASPPFPQF